MSEFEFLSTVTIGQYLPTDSVWHRLDPRAKLVMGLLFLIGVIVNQSMIVGITTLLAVLLALHGARVPLGYALRGLKPVLPFFIFLAALQVFTVPQNQVGDVLWRWWQLTVTLTGLRVAALTLLRFVVLALGLSLLSFSTRTVELTHGIEHLLRPLQRLGVPAHELSLVVIIALRFVPLLALEAERLAKAQASRGADFGTGRGGAFKRARRLLPLLVPLFVTALHRAEMLALAMEARGYSGGAGRTHLIHLHAGRLDRLAVALTLLLTVGLALTRWFNPDMLLSPM